MAKKAYSGATLLELMIVLSILAILGTIGVPSFVSLITAARIGAQTNQINSLLRFARHTAIDQARLTVVCPAVDFSHCSKDWNAPKIVFIDVNHNAIREPQERLLGSMPASPQRTHMHSTKTAIKFYQSGITASPASVRICARSKQAQYARLLTVSLQGKVKLSRDANKDGVHENSAGKALSCE